MLEIMQSILRWLQVFLTLQEGSNVMNNTRFHITVPHFFSPKSAFSAESNSYIVRFNVHETFQINQSDFLISNIIKYEKVYQ